MPPFAEVPAALLWRQSNHSPKDKPFGDRNFATPLPPAGRQVRLPYLRQEGRQQGMLEQ
jgi:hypothetical protein